MAQIIAQSLIDRVRSAADQQNSNYISDDEIITWLNVGAQEIYDILTEEVSDYAITIYVQNTTSGLDNYPLPDDFYRLRGVDVQLTPEIWTTIKRFNFTDRNVYRPFGFGYLRGIANIMYRITGNNIYFIPTPQFPLNYFRIWYVPILTKINVATDTIDDWGGGYEEYAVVSATIKALLKEESDASAWLIIKNELKDRLITMASSRDNSEPESVQDVRKQSLYFPFGLGGNYLP